MPYILNYNGGSFAFEKLDNYVLGLMACILRHNFPIYPEFFRNIVHGSKFISDAAINACLIQHIESKVSTPVIEILLNQIWHYKMREFLNMSTKESAAKIMAGLKCSVLEFTSLKEFPTENEDMVEIFRMFADFGFVPPLCSKWYNDRNRLCDLECLNVNWTWQRHMYNLFIGERLLFTKGNYYLPRELKEEFGGDCESMAVAECVEWAVKINPDMHLIMFKAFASVGYILPAEGLKIKTENAEDLAMKLYI